MMVQKYFLLSLGLLMASALSGQTNLLNDSFTSGTTGSIGKSGATNTGTPGVQSPPASAFWFGNNSTFSPPATPGVSPITYTNGTGILINNAAATTQSVTAFFKSPGNYETLATGHILTLSFNFKLGSAPTYQGTGIRFELINSASTGTGALNNQLVTNTANSRVVAGVTNTTLYSGYFVAFNAGATASAAIDSLYNRNNGNTANLIATLPNLLGTDTAVSPGLVTTDVYQAKLTLLNPGGGAMNVGFSLSDLTTPATNLSAYSFSVTDPGSSHPIITSFDGLTIGENSSENTPMTISNVNVTDAPETAAATPTFSPVAGTYTSTQLVTISSTTAGASIAYTIDGTTPVESGGVVTNGTLYTGPVSVGTNLTINAIAFGTMPNPFLDSPVGSAAYVINNPSAVAEPTFSPGAGTVAAGTVVTISSATAEASIAYTTDGSTPTESGGIVTNGTLLANNGSITISAATTINAIGFIIGLTDSSVDTATYGILNTTVTAPTFNPGGGAVSNGTAVTISSATSGASIAYTTDGSTPAEIGGILQGTSTLLANGGSVPITGAVTLSAIGFKTGLTDSAASIAGYTTFILPASLAPLPSSQVVTSGKTMVLTASATGTPAPTFQWQQSANAGKTWTNLTGQTGSTLTITTDSTLNNDEYRYVATNTGGSVNSSAFILVVNPALFPSPTCIVVDSSGNLYAGDSSNNTIQQINPSGVVRLVAGSTAGTAGSTDGTGSAALFRDPAGITITSDATMLFVADTGNSAIRQIASGGVVTTLASGSFSAPVGVALDASGNVLVADSNNNAIRKVTKTGVVTTFSGPPFVQFNSPVGLAANNSGAFYVSDTNTLRQISDGVVTTLAGATAAGSADGAGGSAGFTSPGGLAVDSTGNIYVADTGNSTIRKVTPTGSVTTLAGQAGQAGLMDGTGGTALFNKPEDLTVDASGNVYVADTLNAAIRKITPAGVVTTLVLTTPSSSSPSSASSSTTSSASGGGGAMDTWFLGLLALAGLLRRRLRKT
jgi:MYXO-CTERM domain-containing protein